MTERWASVLGWEGAYEVSDHGRVRSVEREVPNGGGRTCVVPGRLLTPRKQVHGYLIVTMRKGRSVHHTARVHRLVAQAFVPNPGSKPCVNHIDCRTDSNHFSNLEWCTQAENLAHMTRLGRHPRPMLGRRSPKAILSDDAVREMRADYAAGGGSHAVLSEKYGISKKTVTNVLNRKTYSDVR